MPETLVGLSPAGLLRLQRAAGNSAVLGLLQGQTAQRANAAPAVLDRPAPKGPVDAPAQPAAPPGKDTPARQPPVIKPPPAIRVPPKPAAAQPPSPTTPKPVAAPGPAADIAPVLTQAPAAPPLTTQIAQAPPEAPGGSPDLIRFQQQAAVRRAQLLATSDISAKAIRQAAAAIRLRVDKDHALEGQQMQASFDESIAQVQNALARARNDITTSRDANVAQVREAAQTETANAQKCVEMKQAAIHDAGVSHATDATKAGESEAQKVTSESAKEADQAISIGNRKAAEYYDWERGHEMASEAQQMAAQTAEYIGRSSAQIAGDVRNDGSTLSEKFTDEARDVGKSFADQLPTARSKIQQERDQSIQGLNQMAQDTLTHIESSGRDTIEHLKTQRVGATQQHQQSAGAAAAALDDAAERAVANEQANTLRMVTEIDAFVAGVTERGKRAQLARALDHVNKVADEFDQASGKFVEDSGTALDVGGQKAQDRSRSQLRALVDPVQKTGSSFEAEVTKGTGDVVAKMKDSSAKSLETMRGAVQDVDSHLSKTIQETTAGWDKQLADGKEEMRTKVVKGLALNTSLLQELPIRMDARAKEIADESWLSRAAKFAGGVLVGFLKALAIAVLVLVVVALVVLLVVLIVASLPEGLAIILAAALFIAVYAETIALVIAVIAVIAAIIILGLAIYSIYQAYKRDDLSPEQRGELVGSAIFDIVTLVFGEAIAAKLAKWLAELVDLSRIRPPVPPEVPVVRPVVPPEDVHPVRVPPERPVVPEKGPDPARPVVVDPEAEQLAALRRVIPDEPQLQKLLGMVDRDSDRLQRLVDMTDNTAQLDKFLTQAGKGQGQKLEELLRLAGGKGNAGRLDELLNLAAGDPVEFQRLADAAAEFKRLPVVDTAPPADLHGYSGADMEHFQVRHTYEHFDFGDIKKANTMWPKGTTKPQLDGYLMEALDQMDQAGVKHTAPGFQTSPPPPLRVGGIDVQLGTNVDGAGGREITQFFPKNGPGVDTFDKEAMRAIRKVLTGK